MSLRVRVAKDEEERFCLGSCSSFYFCVVNAVSNYSDMSGMQKLIDHSLVQYRSLLDCAVYDAFCNGLCYGGWLVRPLPGSDIRGCHILVLN